MLQQAEVLVVLSVNGWPWGPGQKGALFLKSRLFAESLDWSASLFCPPKHRCKMGLGDREQHSYCTGGALDYCLCCSLSNFSWQMAPWLFPSCVCYWDQWQGPSYRCPITSNCTPCHAFALALSKLNELSTRWVITSKTRHCEETADRELED